MDEDLPNSVDDNDNSDNDDDNDGVGIDEDNNDDDEAGEYVNTTRLDAPHSFPPQANFEVRGRPSF